jgi:type I restriction enzyme S subunit
VPDVKTQKKISGILKTIDEKIRLNESINKNLEQQASAIFKEMFLDANTTTQATIADISLNVTDGVHNTVQDDPNGECLLLSCKNIKGGYLTKGSNERTISKATFDKLRKRTNLSKGDVLVSSVGTIGEIMLLNESPHNYEFQRSVAMIKPNLQYVSSYYLYEALLAQKSELVNAAHGAVQQCLFIGDIANFLIGVPKKDDLEKFDHLVSPMFDSITSNQKESLKLSLLRDALLPRLMSGELDISDIDI